VELYLHSICLRGVVLS